jgi:hypothetical protein
MLLLYVDPVQRAALLMLLALWAALLFGGYFFGSRSADLARRMPTWTRIGSSLALVAAAWSWYLFTRTTPVAVFALLIALGMTLGLLGDLFLAHVLPAPEATLAGMAAFGLGHIAYIAALLIFAGAHGLLASPPLYGSIALWLLAGLIGWYLVVLRGHEPTTLRWAALPYALLLAGTAGAATGVALQAPSFASVAIGAALFLVSDLILAGQLFNKLFFPQIGDIIWLTYGPAQALIVFGVESALRVVGHR